MSQFTTLNLKNQAATEVAFANSKIDYQTGVSTWIAAGSSFDSRQKATLSMTLPSARSNRARVKAKVSIPIMDVVDATRKVDELVCNVEFVLPSKSILADRQNLRAYVADFLTDAVIVAAVENFEGVY